ncbi:PHD finger protein ALFIN-LIKE 4-like protein [Tanacetum coccineum]
MKDDDDDELDDEDDDGHGATLCRSCGESYVADEFWISCDICERLIHGSCEEKLQLTRTHQAITSAQHAATKEPFLDACIVLCGQVLHVYIMHHLAEGLNSMSKLILEAGGSVYSKYRGMNGMEKRREEESDSLELIYRKCYKQLRKTHLFDMPLRTAEMDPKDSEQNYPQLTKPF